ncbi:uncharacterized protein [Macrobrachium rosenbergii]|uniref:uncharacterized protein n=1 Tax=Macrobrachium rosenbergii TaxID=79674 RepID=UPI0034D55D69
MKAAVVIILTLALIHSGHCFKCYQGIQGKATEEVCDERVTNCMKMDIRYIDQRLIVYGCGAADIPNDGCTTEADDQGSVITCICRTELCNSACAKMLSVPLLLAVLVWKLLLP